MRRDLFHFYPRPVQAVYAAYQQAANERFGKNCRAEPYHTLSFGLNFSFRYNMNGGACTVHLIPYQGGTAVNVRYTIVQLAGARYGAYDREFTGYVEKLLGVPAQPLQISADVFLQPQNQAAPGAAAPQPIQAPAPTPAAAERLVLPNTPNGPAQPACPPALTLEPTIPIRTIRFCDQCGSRLIPGASFCDRCGGKIQR